MTMPADRRFPFQGWRLANPLAAACILVSLFVNTACTNTRLDLIDVTPSDASSFDVSPPDTSLFDPDLGLWAHWALDEPQAGNTVADSSGSGNRGTPSTNPPVPSTNIPPVRFTDPYSLSFNGVDQWVEFGNPTLLNSGGNITVSAWVRAAAIDKSRNILAHGYVWTPDHDFALRLREGYWVFTTWDGSDHAARSPIPASDLGTWVHLCGVFDGSNYILYRNGAQVASTVDSTPPPAGIDAVWAIGARAPQTGNGNILDYLFQGQIDDVRIYGRALSAAEVQALYQR